MTTASLITLFAVMLLLAAIPSASVALVITRSAALGTRNGIAVASGIVLGDLLFVTLAILGLSFLAEAMGTFFAILRYIGAGYLIWYGFSLLRSKNNRPTLTKPASSHLSLATSFASGFLLTLGDIKAILFYASLLPAHLDISSLNSQDIITIWILTIVSVGGVKLFYAIAANQIASRLRIPRAQNLARVTAGCCMIGTGSYILAKP